MNLANQLGSALIAQSDAATDFAWIVLLACYLALGGVAIMGRLGAARGARKHDLRSWLGFFLQGAGYAICFAVPRTRFSPFAATPQAIEWLAAVITAGMAIGSVWFCYAAARALGRQWALGARVIDEHELITRGPYSSVRNPIYLAMFGMLIATGLAVSRWEALAAACVVYLAGTAIRVRTEERLLRETFGPKFDDYVRRVPAFVPCWR